MGEISKDPKLGKKLLQARLEAHQLYLELPQEEKEKFEPKPPFYYHKKLKVNK